MALAPRSDAPTGAKRKTRAQQTSEIRDGLAAPDRPRLVRDLGRRFARGGDRGRARAQAAGSEEGRPRVPDASEDDGRPRRARANAGRGGDDRVANASEAAREAPEVDPVDPERPTEASRSPPAPNSPCCRAPRCAARRCVSLSSWGLCGKGRRTECGALARCSNASSPRRSSSRAIPAYHSRRPVSTADGRRRPASRRRSAGSRRTERRDATRQAEGRLRPAPPFPLRSRAIAAPPSRCSSWRTWTLGGKRRRTLIIWWALCSGRVLASNGAGNAPLTCPHPSDRRQVVARVPRGAGQKGQAAHLQDGRQEVQGDWVWQGHVHQAWDAPPQRQDDQLAPPTRQRHQAGDKLVPAPPPRPHALRGHRQAVEERQQAAPACPRRWAARTGRKTHHHPARASLTLDSTWGKGAAAPSALERVRPQLV